MNKTEFCSLQMKILIICVFHLFVLVHCSLPSKSSQPPLLLLISFDGFRWDYPDIYNLTNFHSLKSRGVHVKYVENQFSTITFPMHFSIVTGLYEETHGIVANSMFDRKLNASASFNGLNDTRWWYVFSHQSFERIINLLLFLRSQNPYTQPIWISNQLANDSTNRRSGVIAWPGSEVVINGNRPIKHQAYNGSRLFDSVLKQIFDWFLEPIETRINLGVIYHYQPDVTGHKYGPISPEMNQTIHECDAYIVQLLQIIDRNEYLKENLNVIITADHGMTQTDRNHQIILADYVNTNLFSAYGSRALVNIFVHSQSDIDSIYKNLSKIEHYQVYKKADIPSEYHYQNNIRIGGKKKSHLNNSLCLFIRIDILFFGQLGYEIIIPGDNASIEIHGDHGYDNRESSMHPIFYAFGPSFRQNYLGEPFLSLDIYPLMLHLLNLNPRQTNGSFDRVKQLLRHERRFFAISTINLCSFMLLSLTLVLVIVHLFNKKQELNKVPFLKKNYLL